MALSFASRTSSRLPSPVVMRAAAHPVAVPARSAAAGSGRAAFAQVVGAGLDAAVARAQLPDRALRQALGADLDRPATQGDAHREVVVYGPKRAGLFGAALSALRQRMAGSVPECEVRGRDRLAALATPLLDLIARQFGRIDARMVVPQEKVDLMNRIDAGAGEALRRQVEQAQAETGDRHSAASLRMHPAALDAVAVPPPIHPGAPATLELTQLPAASTIGTAMVLRHSAATEAGALQLQAEQAPAADAHVMHEMYELAGLSAEPVPLFYASGAGTTGACAAVADAAQRERLGGMLTAVEQEMRALAGLARALQRPLARLGGAGPARRAEVPVLATLCDVVAVGLHRDDLAADRPPAALCVPGAQACVAESPARLALLTMGHAVDVHAAATPWLLPSSSPAGHA